MATIVRVSAFVVGVLNPVAYFRYEVFSETEFPVYGSRKLNKGSLIEESRSQAKLETLLETRTRYAGETRLLCQGNRKKQRSRTQSERQRTLLCLPLIKLPHSYSVGKR